MVGSLRSAAPGRTATLSRTLTVWKMLALTILLFVSAIPPTAAQGLTGERLYDLCRERSDATEADRALSLGFVRGIIDGARLQALRSAGQSILEHLKTLAMCEPPGTTSEQAVSVILRYVEVRPETRPLPAAVVVFFSLAPA